MQKSISLFLVLALLSAPSALAGPIFRMLVPIYIETPVNGANGSIWVSDLTLFNPTTEEHLIKWCSPTEERPCILNLFADEVLAPGETQRGLPARYPKPSNGNLGAIVHIEAVGPIVAPIAAQLRVKDESRNAASAGTEIPVVRESSFRTQTAQLLGVTADERFRTLLRIYDMNLDSADFVVTLFDESSGARLSERTVRAVTNTPQGLYRFEPAYVQIPEVTSGLPNGSRVRIEVAPLTSGSAFWAFVSITNNVTQEFTVVTPQ
jgi:hypothetical protein